MRVVLDTSVYVAGLLNPKGGSGELLRLWRDEAMFEVIASPALFGELLETLHKPKLRGRFESGDPQRAVSALVHLAHMYADPPNPPEVTRDPNDDFLVALALSSQAEALVTLDDDLLVLGHLEHPNPSSRTRVTTVFRPRDLLFLLREAKLR